MKRSSKFMLAFGAAAITFGSLLAINGTEHFKHQRHCHSECSRAHDENCKNQNEHWDRHEKQSDQPESPAENTTAK